MNYSTLVDLVRRNIGAATPIASGDDDIDVLDDDTLIEYFNDAFTMMNDHISGFPAYVEFTKATDGTITVTKPASNKPTVAKRTIKQESYDLYTISDARSYVKVENLTTGMKKTSDRRFIRKAIDNRGWQVYYNRTAKYHDVYDILGKRGFTLFPETITATNTIGIVYRRTFRNYSVSEAAQTTGTGLSDLTITGIYTGDTRYTDDVTYDIKITTAGPADNYAVSVDEGTFSTPVACSTDAVNLDSPSLGLKVAFGAVTGHVLNDVWRVTVIAPSLSDLTREEQRTFPRYWVMAQAFGDIDDDRETRALTKAVGPDFFTRNRVGGALQKFAENRQNIDLAMDLDLSNPLESSIGSGYR